MELLKPFRSLQFWGQALFPTWIIWTGCLQTMTMLCLCWGAGSDLGKGYSPKCKYSHTASKENLWETAPRVAFAQLSPSALTRFPASIFVRVVNTVLGELCLLLLPKKFRTMGHLFWLVGRKFAFSVSLGDGEYEEYLLRELWHCSVFGTFLETTQPWELVQIDAKTT